MCVPATVVTPKRVVFTPTTRLRAVTAMPAHRLTFVRRENASGRRLCATIKTCAPTTRVIPQRAVFMRPTQSNVTTVAHVPPPTFAREESVSEQVCFVMTKTHVQRTVAHRLPGVCIHRTPTHVMTTIFAQQVTCAPKDNA